MCINTPRYNILLGQKIVHVHHSEKHLTEQVVYNFWGKKEHRLFCYNEV